MLADILMGLRQRRALAQYDHCKCPRWVPADGCAVCLPHVHSADPDSKTPGQVCSIRLLSYLLGQFLLDLTRYELIHQDVADRIADVVGVPCVGHRNALMAPPQVFVATN